MNEWPLRGLLEQFFINLRLYFRNKMGMFYGYLFPVIFLISFRMLYRSETIPMVRHLGQLLTVTILGGACMGMPTTLVSERERGVWRRLRLAPVTTGALLANAIVVRYCILITAGLLQFLIAMAVGMPLPKHPAQLVIAFTLVAFAFLGIGLVIAAIADNVPSVQALGQCIFLPMLIIGGVAVPLASLPGWAEHVSHFFPGRYAVESFNACVTGVGLRNSALILLALFLIGVSGLIAGSKMFRWDSKQQFTALGRSGWLLLVVVTWVAIGTATELTAQKARVQRINVEQRTDAPLKLSTTTRANGPVTSIPTAAQSSSTPHAELPAASLEKDPTSSVLATAQQAGSVKTESLPLQSSSWQQVTLDEIKHNVNFSTLPVDDGVVSPIARPGSVPPNDVKEQLDTVKAELPKWLPGNIADPVQRVRNLMYVTAVPDLREEEVLESYVPLVVFDRLKQDIPKDDLIRLLYWVAVHPSGGSDDAVHQLQVLGLGDAPGDMDAVRERVSYYSLKFVGRLIGTIPSNSGPSQQPPNR